MEKVALFGIRPTSDSIHIGHLRVLTEILCQKEYNELVIFLADYHGTISLKVNEIENFSFEKVFDNSKKLETILKSLLSKRVERLKIVHQKDIHSLEIFQILSNLFPKSELYNAVLKQVEESIKNRTDMFIPVSFLTYPLLQAADVIGLVLFITRFERILEIYSGIDQISNFNILKSVVDKVFKNPKRLDRFVKDLLFILGSQLDYTNEYIQQLKYKLQNFENYFEIKYVDVIKTPDGREKLSKSTSGIKPPMIPLDKAYFGKFMKAYKTDYGNPESCLFLNTVKQISLCDDSIKRSVRESEKLCKQADINVIKCKDCKHKLISELIRLLF